MVGVKGQEPPWQVPLKSTWRSDAWTRTHVSFFVRQTYPVLCGVSVFVTWSSSFLAKRRFNNKITPFLRKRIVKHKSSILNNRVGKRSSPSPWRCCLSRPPTAHCSKSLIFVQKLNFDKTLIQMYVWIFAPKLEDFLELFTQKNEVLEL